MLPNKSFHIKAGLSTINKSSIFSAKHSMGLSKYFCLLVNSGLYEVFKGIAVAMLVNVRRCTNSLADKCLVLHINGIVISTSTTIRVFAGFSVE